MHQYQALTLDTLLKACIAYLDAHPDETCFMVGNIAGRDGVDASMASVKKMLDAVVEADRSLIRYNGLGMDGVPYYSLGPNATAILPAGGFAAYFRRRARRAVLEQLQAWLPILISVGALVVSVLAWQTPKSNDEAIQAVNARLDGLHKEQLQAMQALEVEQQRAQASAAELAQDVQALQAKVAKPPVQPKKKVRP